MSDRPVPAGATWDDLAPLLHEVLEEGHADRVLVATSGSSGTPKRVRLSGSALRASGIGTGTVLGAAGRWVLALPTHHVAGLQVLARSVLAGTSPVAVDFDRPFGAASFAPAVEEASRGQHPVYVSLVPTQLHRLLREGSHEGRAALAAVDAVLLGGAAVDPALLHQAREVTRVVTTYGMSETCGGCVYDGAPLPGVAVRIDPRDGRIHLGGAVLADGYVDQPELTAARFITDVGGRWFVTDDRGVWREGHLETLGRVDDLIVTGGHKVEPRDVEAALRALPGVGQALVVGVPDREWGQVVAAILTTSAAAGDSAAGRSEHGRVPAPSLATLCDALANALPPHALPRRILWRDAIPLLPSGKPDRSSALAALADQGALVGTDGNEWQNGTSGH
ncbi:MAG: AMP-binding protein [Ornithinimicrobium sp.]|uniref:AMP-binding protein n=1 Tax=Ornithinimicrobium sp. TaxID=1977084 RepID=UPI0026DF5BB6|nr:AMP-binding protein [Ornithinimicrobium sp.]MDO5739240.1 AMP-binding protein [Ornithinimicrobium sp.]